MVVCQFYQRGACRFGDSCKNEHPGSQRDANRTTSGGGFGGGSNNNRFGAFASGDRYRPNQSSGGTFASRDGRPAPYHLDKADMNNDLTGQRPIYPLSCYGPGRDAPRQLIEGPVEISPEELRLRFYTLRAAGNEPTAQQEESALNEKMQQQVKAILDDIDGAIRYVEEGANTHPNRIDIAKGIASTSSPANSLTAPSSSGSSSNPFLKAPSNAFTAGSSAQTSAFGQTSTPGFGRPAFGQTSNPAQTTSAFGQPSNPGQNASPFGSTSTLGQKPSPFGQPPALGGASGFAKPTFGASGFGQTSTPGSGSAFGQTNSLGQGPAFGQPSAPGTTSAFGQANSLGQKPSPFSNPGFGQSAFGQASQPGANASPFGQQAQSNASPFGQQAQSSTSPFGQQAQSTTSPFGQQAQSTSSPFGQQPQQGTQAPAFGQQTQPNQQANPFLQAQSQKPANEAVPFGGTASSQTSAFGQPSLPVSSVSAFGTQPQNTSTPPSNPFQQKSQVSDPSTTAAPSQPAFQGQTASPFSTQAPQSVPASTLKAQPAPAGDVKIDAKDRFKEGKPEEYEGEQGRILEEIYRRVNQLGRFNDNEEIPLVPPKCEWIVPVPLL
ncbi:Nn.00g049370.m01.CDS01 [Neocucurbitaria sp. VM-36]